MEANKNYGACKQLCFRANKCGRDHAIVDSPEIEKKRAEWLQNSCGPCTQYPCPNPGTKGWSEL